LACISNPEQLIASKPWLKYIHEAFVNILDQEDLKDLQEFNELYNADKKNWVHHKSWNKLFDLIKVSKGGAIFLYFVEAFLGETGAEHYKFWVENGGSQPELKDFLKNSKTKIRASLQGFKEKNFKIISA